MKFDVVDPQASTKGKCCLNAKDLSTTKYNPQILYSLLILYIKMNQVVPQLFKDMIVQTTIKWQIDRLDSVLENVSRKWSTEEYNNNLGLH